MVPFLWSASAVAYAILASRREPGSVDRRCYGTVAAVSLMHSLLALLGQH
jgi:hypothetical protein